MQQMIKACAALIILLSNLVVMPAMAQNAPSSTAGKKSDPRKQTLSFEDELVEGKADKPELFYLFQKKNFNYKRLIRLRENFLPEMRKSSEEIQRNRSSN